MTAKESRIDRVEGIVRAPRQTQYEIVPLRLIRDTKLSYRALGVLTRLLSNESSYRMTSSDLARERKEGRDAVRVALKEVEEAGYLVRERRQNSRGQWVTDMVVYDSPQLKAGLQCADFQSSVVQSPGVQSSAFKASEFQSPESPASGNQAPRTVVPVSNTTTTTPAYPAVHWDYLPQLADEQRVVVVGLMDGLSDAQQQDVLDELAGAFRAGVIKGAWPAWLHKVIQRAREGSFQPSQALSIRAERQRRASEESLAKERRAEAQKRKALHSDPQQRKVVLAKAREAVYGKASVQGER